MAQDKSLGAAPTEVDPQQEKSQQKSGQRKYKSYKQRRGRSLAHSGQSLDDVAVDAETLGPFYVDTQQRKQQRKHVRNEKQVFLILGSQGKQLSVSQCVTCRNLSCLPVYADDVVGRPS